MTQYKHTIIIGAGAAGMMAAGVASQSGVGVLLIDHAKKIGEKIRISGGGRCNFTNIQLDGRDASPFYISQNPRFVRPAMSRYTAQDFIGLLKSYNVSYHERDRGQLFCDDSAQDVIQVLQQECQKGQVAWRADCTVTGVRVCGDAAAVANATVSNATASPHAASAQSHPSRFELDTSDGVWRCQNLIIATGGLSIPVIGATGFGYDVARQFGHTISDLAAALVPLVFGQWVQEGWNQLAGLALPVHISTGEGKKSMSFDEDMMISHKGLTGPALLQISNYWHAGHTIAVNICPEIDLGQALTQGKQGARVQLDTALSQLAPHLSKRLLQHWFEHKSFATHAKHNGPTSLIKS